jgi:hypothetical protein
MNCLGDVWRLSAVLRRAGAGRLALRKDRQRVAPDLALRVPAVLRAPHDLFEQIARRNSGPVTGLSRSSGERVGRARAGDV